MLKSVVNFYRNSLIPTPEIGGCNVWKLIVSHNYIWISPHDQFQDYNFESSSGVIKSVGNEMNRFEKVANKFRIFLLIVVKPQEHMQ